MATKKPTKKAEAEVAQAVATVSTLSAKGVVGDMADLQITVQRQLADLTATITGKFALVEQLDTTIASKQEELKALYDIDAEAAKLEDIKAQREAEEIAAEKERLARQIEAEEEAAEQAKKIAREEEERTYEITQRKARAEADHLALVAKHQYDERVRQQEVDRVAKDREAALKLQETEVAKLKEQAASFEARVKAETDKAVAMATNALKKTYEQEKALAQKDLETAQKLAAAEVASLNKTIESLSEQIDTLKEQLVQAHANAKEIVTKTLEAQSGQSTLAALQKAMETNAQSGKK